MVSSFLTTRKPIIFLFIFLFPLISFAFDAESTHPALTEEIVRYYNAFAKRKILPEEIELLKQGSVFEDKSPRWVNHFYVAFNNTGLDLKTARGVSENELNFFKSLLPYPPLKSPDWAQNEIVQSKYLDNRTYQKAKRLYFENKKEALKTLGYLLHLLEDLGVPDHARGDAHGGFDKDPKSNYEEYAKYITDHYNLTFAKDLIKENVQPYSFRDLDSIFSSLAKFTASNWFSEDTINLLPLPKITNFAKKGFDQKEKYELIYNDETYRIPILKIYTRSKDRTTNDNLIHQVWFNSVVPEILKHGAALLNLYFSEIEEMEKEEAIKLYEFDIGRRVELANFLGFFANLKSYFLSILWQGGEKIVKTVNSASSLFQTEAPLIKSEYFPETNITQQFPEEKTEQQKITYKEERIKEPQEQIAYKEETRISQQETGPNIEKIEISESSKLFSTTTENISTTTNNITTTTEKVSTTTEKRATSTSPQEKENKPKIIYVSGGFGPPSKNPCDDYKNKNYPNILINEIQFEAKTDPKDEFIELYNPNNEEVDLTCWSLEKYASKQNPTSTPTLTKLIPESKFVGKIKPYSFFLITSSSTKEKYQGDLSYAESYSIFQNNTIILKKPNDEISDLVGYGDNNEKIYQFEGSPFIASSTKFENKSIQRKNFKDTNNNLDDFWLHKPKPENSSSLSQLPRQDFADLSQIKIENFNIFPTSTEEGTNLNLEWQEPLLEIASTNYVYEVLISTSTEFNTFKLEDFGTTSSLPLPKFESSTTTFQIEITKCPTTSTLYYFGIYLKDLLDEENKIDLSIASTTLPETLCNPEAEEVVTPTSTTSTVKVLISEVAILEGTSTGEYIELYNPNNFEIDLSGWRLEKINKNGEITVLISSKTRLSTFNNVKIKPYSYLLIANASSSLDILPDLVWSKSHDIAKDNAVRLINDKGEIVDIVGWGSPPLFEGEAFPQNPEENKVLLRKAGINSTENSMANKEKSYGNSYDTDNNKLDFILANPEPQNSFSTSEIPPDYPEEFILRAGGQYLKISFNSPYQKLLNSYYELRVLKNELNDEEIQNNWQSLKKLNVDLPEVGPFGENINIEINACQQGLGDNDILLLGIIHENNLKNFVKAKIKGLDCMIFQSIGSEEFWWGQMGPTYVSKVAQEVLVNKRSFIKNISIQLAKYQNPEDKLWVEIWSEGDKPETGTFLTKTKEIEGSSLTSNTTWVDFTLDQGIILEPGKYFFVLQRSSLNSENFYSSARTIDTDKSSKLWHFLAVEGGWVFYSFYYPPPGPGLITRDLGIQIR